MADNNTALWSLLYWNAEAGRAVVLGFVKAANWPAAERQLVERFPETNHNRRYFTRLVSDGIPQRICWSL